MPLFSVFLHMICLLLACHSYSQYSLIFFGKVLCALVSKVIILSLYLCCFCLPRSSPSSGTLYSFYIQPVICANIPLSLKLPSHCAFFHTLSRSFSPTSVGRVVPAGAWNIPGCSGIDWRWYSEVIVLQGNAAKHQAVPAALWPLTARQERLLPHAFGLLLPYGKGRWCWSGS